MFCYATLALMAGLTVFATADTPANCTYQEVAGTWLFYESERNGGSGLDCSGPARPPATQKLRVVLQYPNTAVDQWGNTGTWTMVYNQGWEVRLAGRSYFAYSDYTEEAGGEVVSRCGASLPGQAWSHDITVRNWACLTAKKMQKPGESAEKVGHGWRAGSRADRVYTATQQDVDTINSMQGSWTAGLYPSLQQRPLQEVLNMRGGRRSVLRAPPPRPSPQLKAGRGGLQSSSPLPASWDWRNVSGQNFVSPVRNQGGCGSCYAFSSMGMLEARVRILTNNTRQPVFSPQDVVSCSTLAQGCEGGFPFLIAGRYGKDYGVVEESCSPYLGKDGECNTKQCNKHYTASYGYVGGYYGACTAEAMMAALVRNGPLSVSFEVYDDFMLYKGGVYHHTGHITATSFTPFEMTNHAVLLVGFGRDPALGEDYWIVKNSWGTEWGEEGFFRIRR